MKYLSSIIILSTALTIFPGCQSNTGTGVLIGGGTGALIGGVAGGGTGALIGGAAGVIAGGLIGSALDNQQQQQLQQNHPQTYRRLDHGERLSINDIINLSEAKVDDDKIISLIKKTNSHYTLNKYQINKLRESGVSETIINYMMYNT